MKLFSTKKLNLSYVFLYGTHKSKSTNKAKDFNRN